MTFFNSKDDLYLSIINNLCDGVYFVDLNRKITFWNKAAEDITGYKADEIIGRKCEENILNHIDNKGCPLCKIGCPLFATLIDGRQRKDKVYLRHRNGYRLPVIVNIFPYSRRGKIVGAVEIFTPITSVVYDDDLVSSLYISAMTDKLTNLPNRTYLESLLSHKMEEYKKFDRAFSVVFLDIDNFSSFNNNYGHDVGDLVLKNISTSIKNSLRDSDVFGRWGGEEFIGIFNIDKKKNALIVGEKIRSLIENTLVETDKGNLSVTASIGVAVIKKGETIDDIVKRADKLMYKSKELGKNRVSC